jgi:hypothetical protein
MEARGSHMRDRNNCAIASELRDDDGIERLDGERSADIPFGCEGRRTKSRTLLI